MLWRRIVLALRRGRDSWAYAGLVTLVTAAGPVLLRQILARMLAYFKVALHTQLSLVIWTSMAPMRHHKN